MTKNLFIFGLSLVILTGCGSGTWQSDRESEYTFPISIDHIRGNLNFLASDGLEGREATRNGERLAAAYISAELQKYGVKPFGDDSSTYLQQVDLRLLRFDSRSSISMIAEDGGILTTFSCDSDFAGSTRYYEDLDTTTTLVFAGYGIVAEEFNYNDYRDLDVKGKIVLFLNGEPFSEDTAYFAGSDRTKYSSWRRKVQTAQDSGAAGVMIPSWSEEQYGWESVVGYVNKGTLSLLDDDDGQSRGRNRLPTISIRHRTLEKILSYSPHPLAEINELVEAGKSLPRFELANAVRIKWGFAPADTVQAWNVLGILPGNDPALSNQHVVIGAHFDHIGVGLAGIYHGADDNASGTVGVLEVAKAFGYNRNNARPVVFAFHTAEEKGLLGSKFLVKNYPGRENIMVHINLDMIGRGAVDSIYSVGSDRISPELKEIVENVNRKTIHINFNYRFDDPNDPERIYYRSDHYSYAREGIPTVFFYDYMQEDYHKITDTADKINLVKVANMVELVYQTAVRLANLPHSLSRNRNAEK